MECGCQVMKASPPDHYVGGNPMMAWNNNHNAQMRASAESPFYVLHCPRHSEANVARLEGQSAELLKRLTVMCREWREIVGTPEENSTPGDTLERAEELIARSGALSASTPRE